MRAERARMARRDRRVRRSPPTCFGCPACPGIPCEVLYAEPDLILMKAGANDGQVLGRSARRRSRRYRGRRIGDARLERAMEANRAVGEESRRAVEGGGPLLGSR